MARQAKATPNKHYPVVTDAWNGRWHVFQSDAGCGVEWHRGWPEAISHQRAGRAQVIITPEAKAFLTQHARGSFCQLSKLPFCACTLKRLRRELSIDRMSATRAWWESRIEDMLDLGDVRFAAKHKVSTNSVAIWRKKLGLPALEHADAWYLQPDNLRLLTSDTLPLLYIARHFSRSIKTIWQLRYQLRKNGVAVSDRR